MADTKPEVAVSDVVEHIEMRFQRLRLCFRDQQCLWNRCDIRRHRSTSREHEMARVKPDAGYISRSRRDRNAIPRLRLFFRD
jgi:hypothetical protein